MLQQLEQADYIRRQVIQQTPKQQKAALGQFMTPSSVARFMASLFPASTLQTCRLLDAGAGVGALSCAFLDRWVAGDLGFDSVELTAYEVDKNLQPHLLTHLAGYSKVHAKVIAEDYIEWSTIQSLQGCYTHAILNPPYKKIRSDSAHRLALRRVGIETVNLYAAFVALAVLQSAPHGQIVAILPRSFCNGPYYRPFREFILQRAAIRHLHLFNARNKAFKDDQVLQESVVIRLECGAKPDMVMVSTSTDDTFDDLQTHEYPASRILVPEDGERFIHIPISPEHSALDQPKEICYSLADIGVNISTGPVVDFRLKEYLRSMPEHGTVPLLYPAHFQGDQLRWPIQGMKKPNAMLSQTETTKWLYPNGFYCVVRRFSSKEEKRRIVASVVNPTHFQDTTHLGFENHLNVFHERKTGLPPALAYGLATFLNSSMVDTAFRSFSGHTQVNATDLKRMNYPSRACLITLGEWAMQQQAPSQQMIDNQLKGLVV